MEDFRDAYGRGRGTTRVGNIEPEETSGGVAMEAGFIETLQISIEVSKYCSVVGR